MDGDTFGRLAYLILLVLAIGGWFFSQNRQSLNKTLQQIVLWVFLFLGVIAIYGLKDDISWQTLGVARVEQQGETVVLRRSSDGHYYAPLRVNGNVITFVVDTGATDIVLSKEDARTAGIVIDDLVFFGRARTANGTVETAPVRLDSLALGEHVATNISASVNGGEMSGSLLGMSYLNRFSKIEIVGNELRLIP